MQEKNKKNNGVLHSMRFVAEFDREVDLGFHYITPGGYSIKLNSGKTIEFDFGTIHGDEISANSVSFEAKDVLFDEFPDALNLTKEDILYGCQFNEFFIFNGEQNEPEIYCTSVHDIVFTFEGEEKLVDICFMGEINVTQNREPNCELDTER